jgi:hypothetical protein
MSIFSKYQTLLLHHPIKSNLATAFVISFTGDVAAQYLEHSSVIGGRKTPLTNQPHLARQPFSPDLLRTMEMNSWAIFGLTPLNMFQQGYLAEKLWPIHTPQSIIAKVLLCVAFTAPNNVVFFSFRTCFRATRDRLMHLFQGATEPEADAGTDTDTDTGTDTGTETIHAEAINIETIMHDIKRDLDHKLKDTVVASWSLWTVVNATNFALVPSVYRHVYTSVVAVCWTSYLSWKSNDPIRDPIEGARQVQGVPSPALMQQQQQQQREPQQREPTLQVEVEVHTTTADIHRRIQAELEQRKKIREDRALN